MDWQLIETAPRDRTKILIYGKLADVTWEAEQEMVVAWHHEDDERNLWVSSNHHYLATHWCPLPVPPPDCAPPTTRTQK